jgi:DNA-binding transcriptional regulator YiaG
MSPFGQKLDAAFRDIFAGKVTVREVEIPDPGRYGPKDVRATRQRLGVSTEVFARLMGVSAKLVEHWEQGRRTPSLLAARLLDRINTEPDRFLSDLLRSRKVAG